MHVAIIVSPVPVNTLLVKQHVFPQHGMFTEGSRGCVCQLPQHVGSSIPSGELRLASRAPSPGVSTFVHVIGPSAAVEFMMWDECITFPVVQTSKHGISDGPKQGCNSQLQRQTRGHPQVL